MQSRKWNLTKDYSVISKWCKAHKWDLAIPKEMLPLQGVMVLEKENICAAGLYIDKKAKFGFMYGLFSNPKTSKIKLFKAMKKNIKIWIGYLSMSKDNALQKIESHEKLCRVMQKQTHDKILKLEQQINRVESILLVSVGTLVAGMASVIAMLVVKI